MDNKLSFITGWMFTTASTMTTMGMLKAAVLGLVGGFFGLAGKELYYWVKDQVKKKHETK